jgi:oxygen-dependent protoporphyrinogen oxidase
MSGIYAGDGDKLSLQATLPYLRDLELNHGGLVKGALAVRRERVNKAKANGNSPKPTPGSRSIFLTPLTGLAEIVEALVQELEAAGVVLKLNSGVESLERSSDDNWCLTLSTGENLESEAIILATPAYVSGALIENFAPNLAAELTAIEYVSTATVTLAFQESDLPRPLDGYGYVIPRREGRKALACTWTSTKFPHRSPDGHALIRVFVGRAGQENQITWEDDDLLEIAREELECTLGITAEPLLTRIYQWEKAMPQYNLGHPARLERINTMLENIPGLGLAGNGYEGIGIPDCIHSGELAVGKILQQEKYLTAQR